MKTKIRERNEVPKQDAWDLTSLYKTVDDWEQDIVNITEIAKSLEQFKGTMVNSSDKMLEALKKYSLLQEISE